MDIKKLYTFNKFKIEVKKQLQLKINSFNM